MAFSHELDADRIHWFSHLKWRSMKTLTCLGPRCTGVAPGHRCRCAAPPTSLLTPADTAAGRRPSWKTTLWKSARRSQTWRWLQWAHPLPTEREDYTGQVCQTGQKHRVESAIIACADIFNDWHRWCYRMRSKMLTCWLDCRRVTSKTGMFVHEEPVGYISICH